MSEEYETAIDELKSSNEELVSVNEELQSTNEELEASKEELVSLNEELHTVNLELSGKVDELDQANSDLQNLFESTAVATVFLDRDLVIRSYTPAMTEVFNILAADRGRPITDLASPLKLPQLKTDIQRVFDEQVLVERRIATEDGTKHYLVRLAPYRNGSRQTEGVVIAFVNLTSLTEAEARQQVLISELQHRTRNLLAVVQSIAMQTLGRGDAVDAFYDRLAALGRLQGIVGMTAQGEVDLQEIVQLEIDAIGVKGENKITISGPGVPIRLEAAQAFVLALHELATNALKYGALKAEAGHLDITWRIEGYGRDRRLTLNRNESGLARLPETTRYGYGRQLIEKALTFTLKARTQLRFETDGVRCRIDVPLEPPPLDSSGRKLDGRRSWIMYQRCKAAVSSSSRMTTGLVR